LTRERAVAIIGILVAITVFLLGYVVTGQASPISAILSMFAFLISLHVGIRLDISDILVELKSRRTVERVQNKFVREMAQAELKGRDSILDDIAQSRIRFDSVGSMMYVYYELVKNREVRRIRATSMVSLNVVWESERGRRALEENLNAVKRGVSIERIFIFPSEQTRDSEKAKAHLKAQADGGITVRTLLAHQLESANCRDFMLTDNGILLEYSIGPDGDIVACVLSTNDRDVTEYSRIYEQIKAASTEFKP